ncbi:MULTISPECIES: DUF501 domain-containing protein [Larsenimonas]|uniref:DUF501 domain-containing protein n=1 Tax=Larsenimonas suaedae TaxID=1851019 RepID=A0ABU1GX26_9GAMM|nr:MULTISPECIES: DUF501 domain-containing protein [Larsenimonas]MCM2973173.1 DUF501 domain-containing protein [Larsenimonas suaedae]MCM5705552.1 DUF501 domain-containing protein [Larsenimonas salina]MDR5896610.1 DUF501 domain-containing protein [Larsenimonas suaedae]
MIHHTDNRPTEAQLTCIERQLGRAPNGIQAVSAENDHGTPLVLRMHSLVDGKPFPTLYWLSSQTLKVELSRLEAQGVIKALEDALAEDTEFMARYRASHEDYVQKRWHYMTDDVRQAIVDGGFEPLMRERGVGGITNWSQVRCLHTQYAHHLCGDNAIGQWIDQHYPDIAACALDER